MMRARGALLGQSLLCALFCWHTAACVRVPFLRLPQRPLRAGSLAEDNAHSCKPRQVHLSLTGDDTEMTVMWLTDASGCPSAVDYWAASNGVRTVEGLTDSYEAADMCSSPARNENFDPPNIHIAVMTDLEPGRRYHYSIDDGSYENEFQAPPRHGSTQRFTFLAYGDMGEPYDEEAKSPLGEVVMSRVEEDLRHNGGDMVLHVGDLSYAEGKSYVWDRFFDMIEPTAARLPYMIGVGNHEYDYTDGKSRDPSGWTPYLPDWGNYDNGSGGECGVPTAKRFRMPGQDDPDSQAPFWYEFSYGTAHFIMISSEHPMDTSSPQYAWLKSALKRVDRCVTPWLVVAFHRPMYVPHPHKGNTRVGKHLRREFEHLLSKYNVDVAINGHVHSYLRTCPLYNKECLGRDVGGVVHLVIGTGGHKLSDASHNQAHWAESVLVVPGYGRFDIDGADGFSFAFINAESGDVEDSFSLEPRPYLCDIDVANGPEPDDYEDDDEEWLHGQWDWYFGEEEGEEEDNYEEDCGDGDGEDCTVQSGSQIQSTAAPRTESATAVM
mmetsp:Transcript_35139/g.91248  ORF Transcript_35139/g.91248 Transcript_35139/m.91248 type:complete len:550 (+) Transcript_35139:375-2024(+)